MAGFQVILHGRIWVITEEPLAMSCSDIFSDLFLIEIEESSAQVASQLKPNRSDRHPLSVLE